MKQTIIILLTLILFGCNKKIEIIDPETPLTKAELILECFPDCSKEDAVRIAKSSNLHSWYYPKQRVLYNWIDRPNGGVMLKQMYLGEVNLTYVELNVEPRGGPRFGNKVSNCILESDGFSKMVSVESNNVGSIYSPMRD